MRKILFLDIDGVLNNPESPVDERRYRMIDPSLARMLNDGLKDIPGLEIVLSTTWAKVDGMIGTTNALRTAGLTDIPIIDRTPTNVERWEEICDWLDGAFGEVWCNEIGIPVENSFVQFVVLDDIKLTHILDSRWVRTDWMIGVTPEDINSIKKLFNSL